MPSFSAISKVKKDSEFSFELPQPVWRKRASKIFKAPIVLSSDLVDENVGVARKAT